MRLARRYSQDPGTQQDIAQEGWIAAWRAIQNTPDHPNLEALSRHAARLRIIHVIARDVSFGSERPVGRNGVVKGLPLDSTDEQWAKLTTTDDQVELAYHQGEISRAIDGLTPAQAAYVRLRFWADRKDSELAKLSGQRDMSALWYRTKSKLKPSLEHLRGE